MTRKERAKAVVGEITEEIEKYGYAAVLTYKERSTIWILANRMAVLEEANEKIEVALEKLQIVSRCSL